MRTTRPVESGTSQLELRIRTPEKCGQCPAVLVRPSPAKPTIVYDTYWRFAFERQEVFFRRMHRQPPPWTRDPVLQRYKFTNVYRACDRVSQYLIREVIPNGDNSAREVFFRTI